MANCGNKRDVFKTSEASTKAWFRTNGIIDNHLNILNLAEFRKQTTKWTNYAKIKNKVDEGRIFLEENNGTKAIPNQVAFHKIDASKGIFYPENEHLKGLYQTTSQGKVNESLDTKLKVLLQKLGINVLSLDNIRDSDGNIIDVVAKADLLQSTIEIIEGKRGLNTLSEETAHFIVELLPSDHPLLVSAMKRVESTEMYKQVKEEYSTLYEGDELKLKKEAIGKLISQEIVNTYKQTKESSGTTAWINSWFKAVTNWFKTKFKGISSNDVFNISNPYKQIAEKILAEDIGGLKKIEEVVQEYKTKPLKEYFYQISNETKLNKEQIVTLLKTQKIVPSETGYKKLDGTEVKRRVSDKSKAFYKKIFGEEPKSLKTDNLKLKGTYIHKIKQISMNRLINGQSIDMGISEIRREILNQAKSELMLQKDFQEAYNKYGDKFFELADTFTNHILSAKSLSDSVRAVFNNIQENQKKLNTILGEEGKAEIFTELTVYDESSDTGGTIDLLVVYSNGAVGIYDYKAMDFSDKSYVAGYKEQAFEIQLSNYQRILANNYKVTDFAECLVIPTGMILKDEASVLEFTKDSNTENDEKYRPYLNHIPIKSMTFDEDINKVLDKLYKEEDLLRAKINVDFRDEKLKSKLYKVRQAIKKLAIFQDYNYIISIVNDLSEDFHNRETLTKDSKDVLNNDYLKEISDQIKLYEGILNTIADRIEGSNEYSDKEKLLVASAVGRLNRLSKKVEQKAIANVNTYSAGGDITKPGREIGLMGRIFNQLSEINHPAFKKLSEIVRANSNKTREEVKEIIDDIEIKRNALNQWASSKGISLYDAYSKLIQKNKKGTDTKLIDKYNDQFREDREKAINNKDKKWFLQNTQIVEKEGILYYEGEIQKEFEEARNKKIADLNKHFEGKKYADKRESELKIWDAKYNITENPSAIFNKKNWLLRAKDNEKYFTEEWKYMLANQPLKEFYDTLVSYNKKFASITGREIKWNFIPNVRKDLIAKVMQNGAGSLFDMKNNFLDSIEVTQEDVIKGRIDPNTGEPIQAIPLLFTDTIDVDLKSNDLARNLILFAKTAYSYKHLSETESLVLNIKAIISSAEYKTKVVGSNGKLLKNSFLGKVIEKTGMNSSDVEVFEKFINMYWYGKNVTGDFTFNIGDKEYSAAKIVSNLQQYITTKSLGLNVISSAGNAIGSYSNFFMTMSEGKYFTRKNLTDSRKLLSENNEKYIASIELFEPFSHDQITERANKISASSLERLLTMDNLLFMMKKPDEFLDKNILVSMLYNYTIKDGKIVKKQENDLPLIDMIEKDKDNNWNLPNVSKEELWRFRHMVQKIAGKIKGTMPEYDKNLANNTVAMQTLMQFKNWIPGLYKNRFGELKYDETLQDFEVGRMNVAISQILGGETLKDNLGELKNLLGEVVTGGYLFGGLKKINTSIAEKYRQKYLTEHPEMADKLTLEEYVELRKQKLQGAVTELRFILSFLMLVFGIKAVIPDDDKEGISKLISRNGYMMANRGFLELTFFYSPKSVDQLITSPFTLYGIANDLQSWISNTSDEWRDLLVGENSKQDKSPFTYYTVTRFLPFGKPFAQVTDIYDSFKVK